MLILWCLGAGFRRCTACVGLPLASFVVVLACNWQCLYQLVGATARAYASGRVGARSGVFSAFCW